MLSVPESTSYTWRLSVKTVPEKPRFIIVGIKKAAEKPRFIIVVFQTAIDGDETKNPFTFDQLNLRNAL